MIPYSVTQNTESALVSCEVVEGNLFPHLY